MFQTLNQTKAVLELQEKETFKFVCPPCGPSNKNVPYTPGTGCDKIGKGSLLAYFNSACLSNPNPPCPLYLISSPLSLQTRVSMTCWKCRCPKFSFSMCLDSLVFCRHFSTTDCNLLVDDCDEDTFPPTIDLDEATHGIIFLDDQSAQDWLHHHSVAGDDCAENLKTTTALYDNSIIGQHTYSVTVWDERCYGKSPSANNTKFYTLSICHESLNQFLKGSGCDGIDQDCDGKDDDCDEDRTPPTINFDKAAMPSHPFSTQEEAMEFLNCQVSVEDDCSTKVERTFKHLADQTVGITNTYRVTAVDTRCEGKSVYATSTLDIEVMVDEEAPSIFAVFIPAKNLCSIVTLFQQVTNSDSPPLVLVKTVKMASLLSSTPNASKKKRSM